MLGCDFSRIDRSFCSAIEFPEFEAKVECSSVDTFGIAELDTGVETPGVELRLRFDCSLAKSALISDAAFSRATLEATI